MSTPASLADGRAGKTDVFAGSAAFSHVQTDGVRFDARAGGFRLSDAPDGGYRRDGTVTSPSLRYGFGFNSAVASWNADCPEGTWVRVELQVYVKEKDAWTAWYEMATWGDPTLLGRMAKEGKVKGDDYGRVNEDIFELKETGTRLRYRLTLHTERPEFTPVVTLVSVALKDTREKVEADDTPGPAWGVEVPADYRSQLVENADLSWRVCGPTSVTMGLSAHGVRLPTADVARACWDDVNAIYGNWPFLAAGASRLLRENADSIPPKPGKPKTFASFVMWPPDWKAVEQEVLAGNPCVLSINFARGELSAAPYRESDGHLILVRGFTSEGHVICNDPNAWNEEKGRIVYDRGELHRARHGGPIIVIRPYG